MRTSKFILTTLAILAFGLFAKAQNADQTMYIVEYMKVKPGMYDDYLKCEKAWKTVHQERIRLGKIVSWALYELAFPSGTDADYDFMTITEVKGWNGIENANMGFSEAMKVVTPAMQPLMDNTESYRDLTRREVWGTIDRIYKEGVTTPAKFQVANYMHVPEGRWDEYWSMETELVKPVHQYSIKAGYRLGWGAYRLVLPYSETAPYGNGTVDFYDKWSDINRGQDEAWMKVHPDMDEAYLSRRVAESRTLVKSEIRVLVDSAQ